MTVRRWRLGTTVALAAVALTAVSTVAAHDDDDRDDVDVKVAKLTSGRCGKPADSLPVLISATGARPGEVVGDVTVCVTNSGEEAGLLSLRALELVDVDPACTGAESTRDATCGRGRRGELSSSLLQQVGLSSCPSIPPGTDPALDRRLPVLAASPLVVVERLRRKQLACVRLRLRYEPVDEVAREASQSDRTTWRYVFALNERR